MTVLGYFVVLLLLIATVDAAWKTCKGKQQAKVSSVKCNGVSAESGCKLKKGANATLVIAFVPSVAVTGIKSVCHGIVAGIPVPFKGIDADGCHGMNPSCPLVAGKPYTFTTSIEVKSIYPSIRLIIEWEEQNGSDELFCLMIPAQIV